MKSGSTDLTDIATTVQRLGVLLAAGVTPNSAWEYLGEWVVPSRVARAVVSGQAIPDAILEATRDLALENRATWSGVAAAWAVATDAGAPLAPTLLELSGSIRDLAQAKREIAVALASPTATARLVLLLPIVGLVFGTLLGFNTIATLTTTPIGWACLVLGGALLIAARSWNRRMVASAQPRETTPGLELDLLAIAVAGGGALERAQAFVSVALERYVVQRSTTGATVVSVLELSRRAGIPAAALLRSEAAEARRSARGETAERAQTLSVRLMIPLGVCVLPAFMLLSVVPLVVTVFASTSLRL